MSLRETRGVLICFLAFLALTHLTIAEESTLAEDTVVIAIDSDDAKKNVFNGFPPTGIYEKLVTRNREGGYDGWLAESWESDDDASEWIFHLADARWHDGHPFTSEDVKFTHDYIKENKLWLSSVLSKVDYVDCPDEHTVVFYLKTPYPAFLDSLSHCPGVLIGPKHIWEDINDPEYYIDEEFIGTGPFKFVNSISDQYVKMEANENYHGGEPHVKEVIFRVITNKDSQILALKSGEVDVVSDISPAVARSLGRSGEIKIFTAPETRGYELGFNLNNYPTETKNFRRALAHTIDREMICNIVFDGYATPTYTTFLMPSVAYDFVNPDVPGGRYEYDLDEAEEILDSAGFVDVDGDGWREGPDGEDVTLTMPLGGKGGDVSGKIAEVLKENWKDLGIRLELEQTEFNQWFEEIHQSNLFIVGMPYLMHDDADDLAHFECNSFFGKTNWYDYDSSEYNELTEELRSTADREERKEIGYRMQEILAEDVPTVPICTSDVIFAYRSDRFEGWDDAAPMYWDVDVKMLLNTRSV